MIKDYTSSPSFLFCFCKSRFVGPLIGHSNNLNFPLLLYLPIKINSFHKSQTKYYKVQLQVEKTILNNIYILFFHIDELHTPHQKALFSRRSCRPPSLFALFKLYFHFPEICTGCHHHFHSNHLLFWDMVVGSFAPVSRPLFWLVTVILENQIYFPAGCHKTRLFLKVTSFHVSRSVFRVQASLRRVSIP